MNAHPNPAQPAFLLALLDPEAHGFPTDPRLRLPFLAWTRRDPSPEAQALARGIWSSFPGAFQSEVRELMGWPELDMETSKP